MCVFFGPACGARTHCSRLWVPLQEAQRAIRTRSLVEENLHDDEVCARAGRRDCVAVIFGCSVFMAASGKREPNLNMITIGSHRAEVGLQLGSPRASVAHDGGQYRTDTYEYELDNEPSAGRAVAHGVMDVLTLGLWELVGTPVEAFKGEKREVVIACGSDDRVAAINRPPKAVAQPQAVTHKPEPSMVVAPARPPPVVAAQASPPTTPWEWLRAGMTSSQVKSLLGEPSEVSEGRNSSIWFYDNSYVAFRGDGVASWRGP